MAGRVRVRAPASALARMVVPAAVMAEDSDPAEEVAEEVNRRRSGPQGRRRH